MKARKIIFLSLLLFFLLVGFGLAEAYHAASAPTSGYITFSNRYHCYENDIDAGWGIYLSYPINKYRLLPTPDEVFTTSDNYDSGPKTGYKWAWKAGYCGNWYNSLDKLLPDGTWTSPTYIVDAGTSVSHVRSLFDESEADAFLFLELKEVPISYSIYYDGNGATAGSMSKSSHTYDAATNLTENGYEKTGYTFAGWNTKEDGSGKTYTNQESVKNLTTTDDETVILYAQWDHNNYTVTYHGNGGTTAAKSAIYHYEDEVSLSATAKKEGYTFVGWSTDPDARMPLSSFSISDLISNGNKDYSNDLEITLYAIYSIEVSDVENHTYPEYIATSAIMDDEVYLLVWLTADTSKYKCYPLVYETEDIATDVDKMTYKYKLPKTNISSFVGNNAFAYQIIAFDNAGNSAVLYEGTSDGSSLEDDEIPKIPQYYNQRIEFYQYDVKKKAYSVCENIEPVNVEAEAGTTFSVNNYLPTAPSGYKLSEIVYPTGYTVSNNFYTVKETATVKVFYVPINYRLVFNVNLGGGKAFIHGNSVTGAVGTITYEEYYANVSVSGKTGIPVPECEGYVFNGWNTQADGSGSFIKGNDIYQTAGNTIVYAQWTPNKLTIHYNANGGRVSDTSKGYPLASDGYMMLRDGSGRAYKDLYYNTTDETVNVHNISGTFGVTKTGYHLVNGEEYRINNPGTGAVIDDDAEPVETFRNFIKKGNASVTLYSNWQANAYTIKYNANGGTGTMENTSAIYDTPVALSPNGFEREGYTFVGWSTTKAGTKVYEEKQMVSNLTASNNGTVTLYAVWSMNSYNVEYDYQINGGTTVSKSGETLAYGSSIYTNAKSVTATKKDAYGDTWTHVGWNTDQAATTAMGSTSSWACLECGKNHSMSSMPDHDITLYAIYKKEVTAKFIDSVPAKTMTKKVILYNTEVSKPIDIPTQTAINGWKSYGWSTSEEAGVPAEYSEGVGCELGRSMTFYALYDKEVCISYDSNGSAQVYTSQQGTRYYNASGNYVNPIFTIAAAAVFNDHSFVNWSVSGGPVQNESGAQISSCTPGSKVAVFDNTTLIAVWDAYPKLEAYDRYFTLEQAKNGEITEKELLKKVKATDKEDGILVNGTNVVVKEYAALDFTGISEDTELEVTYQAIDGFGNVATKTVTVNITDTNMKKRRTKSYVRFISSQFFQDAEGRFIDSEQGGLEKSSVWRYQDSYVKLLEKALFGTKDEAEIWTFTSEELKKMKKDL